MVRQRSLSRDRQGVGALAHALQLDEAERTHLLDLILRGSITLAPGLSSSS